MSDAIAADRKATEAEVRAHADEIRRIAGGIGLGAPRVRDDGALVIHAPDAGYRSANSLSAAVSVVVGAYAHVITDDVPGAALARPL
jgi:hypothetical protein